ncbi:hypothetical protein Y032_0815g2494 [Ancylostoma ceylanicum]|uniref:Uncharacterized protein n=1 Tax=Ancylostoma ceylanicum TaxID=53326 RepID=A0A016WD36_9BILA|nr:hypothetical protein Y032_0815g2494 [Ancylostoma ceylanicum]
MIYSQLQKYADKSWDRGTALVVWRTLALRQGITTYRFPLCPYPANRAARSNSCLRTFGVDYTYINIILGTAP